MDTENLNDFSERLAHENSLHKILEEIIVEINKLNIGIFELNDTTGYYSIQVSGRKRNKNVVCFVKNEAILSVNVNANISNSFLENPPYNRFKRKPIPPKGLQLRPNDWNRYPIHIEYNLKKDKELILKLCQKACVNFLH